MFVLFMNIATATSEKRKLVSLVLSRTLFTAKVSLVAGLID